MKNTYYLLVGLLLSFQLTAQWQKQASNTEASFRTVCAVSEKVVWVSGSKGTFLRTTNGGTTWETNQVAGAEKLDFRDIHAFDAKTAVLMSAGEAEQGNAKFFRTEDGGNSWKLVYESNQKGVFFDGIDFWDKQHGIAFSDPIDGKFFILRTNDGGKSWSPVNPVNIPLCQENEAAFAASGTSLLTVGKNQAYICTGGSSFARIFHSNDQGNTWSVVQTTMPAGKTNGLFGLRFWDKQHGIAVGGDYQEVNKAIPNVLLTADSGKTWQDAPQTNPVGLKEGVALFNKKTLIAVGPSGTCYSKDFGKSWTIIDKTPYHAISISGNGIWAVGGKGAIGKLNYKSLD
ncbi:MAG: WD40/YVTN/BNR-like repeat-containing protein [Spirosomataceae bacterium]